MILVDHISGDPLANFTYKMIGFSDAAEIFVFVSGLACGIAYSRVFARQGYRGLTAAVSKRLVRIYIGYALSSVAMILLVTAAMYYMTVTDSVGIEAEQPADAITSALFLITPPPLSGILVLYIVLTCLVVPPLIVARGRYQNLALGVSGFIWVISQFTTEQAAFLTHKLFFNPFAWQFLFAIGVMLGINREKKSPILRYLLAKRAVIIAAWTVAIGALLIKILSSHSLFDVAVLRLDMDTATEMKENLTSTRLIHFLSVAFLVAVYFRQDSAILKSRLARPLIAMGANSLQVFSISVVLTIAMNLFVVGQVLTIEYWLAINGLAFLFLAVTALVFQYFSVHRSVHKPQSQFVTGEDRKFG